LTGENGALLLIDDDADILYLLTVRSSSSNGRVHLLFVADMMCVNVIGGWLLGGEAWAMGMRKVGRHG
jgi:hypothetical protein